MVKKPAVKKPVAKKAAPKKEETLDEFDFGATEEPKEEQQPKSNAADDLADLDFGMGEEQPAPAPAKKPVAKKPVAKKPVAKKPVAKKPVAKKAAPKKEESLDDFLGMGGDAAEATATSTADDLSFLNDITMPAVAEPEKPKEEEEEEEEEEEVEEVVEEEEEEEEEEEPKEEEKPDPFSFITF